MIELHYTKPRVLADGEQIYVPKINEMKDVTKKTVKALLNHLLVYQEKSTMIFEYTQNQWRSVYENMHKAIDEALHCTHPGRRWKRKLKRARRVLAREHKRTKQ